MVLFHKPYSYYIFIIYFIFLISLSCNNLVPKDSGAFHGGFTGTERISINISTSSEKGKGDSQIQHSSDREYDCFILLLARKKLSDLLISSLKRVPFYLKGEKNCPEIKYSSISPVFSTDQINIYDLDNNLVISIIDCSLHTDVSAYTKLIQWEPMFVNLETCTLTVDLNIKSIYVKDIKIEEMATTACFYRPIFEKLQTYCRFVFVLKDNFIRRIYSEISYLKNNDFREEFTGGIGKKMQKPNVDQKKVKFQNHPIPLERILAICSAPWNSDYLICLMFKEHHLCFYLGEK